MDIDKITISLYGIAAIKSQKVQLGEFGGNYQIESTQGTYFLKLYKKDAIDKNILKNDTIVLNLLNEIQFSNYPQVVLTQSGESIGEYTNHFTILQKFIKGKVYSSRKEATDEHIYEIGLLLGDLHNKSLSKKIAIDKIEKFNISFIKELENIVRDNENIFPKELCLDVFRQKTLKPLKIFCNSFCVFT